MNNARDRHYQRVTINNQTNNKNNCNKNGPLKSRRRAIAPPKLIVTRSRTPPTDTSAADQSHIDVDHRRNTRPTGSCVPKDCMATKQLSPTFPTSSSSSALSAGGVGSSFATFRCHSNPTSPNYLHPTCFNFTNSGGGSTFGPSPRLSRRRPGSASRFGRHSSNGSLPQSPPLSPNANNNHSSFAFNLSLTATTTPSSSSPQLSRSADINVVASIPPLLPIKTATSETSEQKLTTTTSTTTMRNRNVLTRHLPERPEYSVVHYSAKGKQQQSHHQHHHHHQHHQTGLRTMNSPPGGATDNDDDDEDEDCRTSADVAVTVEDSSVRHLKRSIETDVNEEDIKSQENITLNGKSERSRPPSSAGRSHRASWVLQQQQSYSIESVDSNPGPFQDFGIRDYLNMTGESIDNEEESSLAGDFNIGLGVRPPRFSIDSLIDAFTMSHLLEMDETNDKLTGLQLSPSSSGFNSTTTSTTATTTSTGLPLSPSSPSPRSAARRRCSDETGLLSRKTYKYQPELNSDARNHGGIGAAATRTHGITMTSMTSHPSGRLLRKCNSLPHSCLPKINEGGPSVQADLRVGANTGSDTKARDLMKVSREAGTIEEMDDCDWGFDEQSDEDNPEKSKEPE